MVSVIKRTVKDYVPVSDKVSVKKKVNHYVNFHPGCTTSQIIEDLGIHPLIVVETLKGLKKEGSISSKSI
jgi:predicted ArsR family transcriptional regulator